MTVNVYDYSGRSTARTETILTIVRHVLAGEGEQLPDLNIIIADDVYLKNLNKHFLDKNKPTNVLAFPLGEVNEIYVSLDQAGSEAELYYYIIHGLLHLIGYDHSTRSTEKKMHEQCLYYLNETFPEHAQ